MHPWSLSTSKQPKTKKHAYSNTLQCGSLVHPWSLSTSQQRQRNTLTSIRCSETIWWVLCLCQQASEQRKRNTLTSIRCSVAVWVHPLSLLGQWTSRLLISLARPTRGCVAPSPTCSRHIGHTGRLLHSKMIYYGGGFVLTCQDLGARLGDSFPGCDFCFLGEDQLAHTSSTF